MSRESERYGISDITSSEDKLKRFTLICRIVGSEKGLTLGRIEDIAGRMIGSPLGNKTVADRHLMILERIGLIENLEGRRALSSEGKALFELAQGIEDPVKLSLGERVIYFKNMFTSVLTDQLRHLLRAVEQYGDQGRKETIRRYFSTDLATRLWSKDTIERNLENLREGGKVPSFFENKFRCMEMWLEDIRLLRKEERKIVLSTNMSAFLREDLPEQEIKDRIYEFGGELLLGDTSSFSYSTHRKKALELFTEAYSRFKTVSDMSDIRAIMTFVCTRLLTNRIVLEERRFNSFVTSLSSEGLVKSVMLGRDGKPEYVML